MLTHDEVIWGYRYILGRDPENEAIIRMHASAAKDVSSFRQALLESPEFTRSYAQTRESCWVAAPVFGGARLMWIDLRDRYVSLNCLRDAYEPIETTFIRNVLKPDHVFVDVGANIGWFTMLASTIVGDGGHVHSFEPLQPIVDYLQRSVALNALERMITIHRFGLSNENKTEILVWGTAEHNGGGASLARGNESSTLTRQMIEVRSLDSLGLAHVDVIKIDVEGAELLVLEGATSTVERSRPIILTEILPGQLQRVSHCSTQRYFDLFRAWGYRGYIIDERQYGEEVCDFPAAWEKNVINIGFIPSERSAHPLMFNI